MIALVSYCKFTKLVSRGAIAEANASETLSPFAVIAGIVASAALGTAAVGAVFAEAPALAASPNALLGALSVAAVGVATAALLMAQSRLRGLKLELEAQRRGSMF